MVHLRLLGGAIVEDESGVATGAASGRHPLAILALLATAPSRTLSRGKLVGFLWRDSPEEKGRNRLNTYVHRIRSALGEGALVSVGDDLRLDPEALACDVCQFEEALEAGDHERAVALYGGPFLDGFRLGDSPAFEHRVDRERARLREGYRGALDALAEAAEVRGEPEVAARWWRERANDDPYDSRVIGRLIEALEAAGNRVAALRAARVHAQLLEQELGTEPDSTIRELTERLQARVERAADLPPVLDDSAPPEREPSAAWGTDREGVSREPSVRGGGGTPRGHAGSPAGDERPPSPGVGRRRAWVAVAAVLLLGGAGLWALLGSTEQVGPPAGAPAVAVLAFHPAGGGEESSLLADGLHEDLLTRLANVSGLKVISGTSARRYRNSGLSLPAIADSLGATWIVEGGVQEAGGELRVNAQLIDPRTDHHLWAATYRRALTAGQLFAIQEEIARSIVRALEARLAPGEEERIGRKPTDDLEAYRLYLQGRRHLGRRTEADAREAVRFLRGAIELDSAFALAWSGLSDAVGLQAGYGWNLEAGPLPDPEEAARRALELDPDLAEAHASLGLLFGKPRGHRDAPAALASLERAIELKPGYAQAHHWLGLLRVALGDLDRATSHLALAVELDPTLYPAWITLSWAHLARGEAEKALAALRRASDLERRLSKAAMDSATARHEGFVLFHQGRFEEARRIARRGVYEMRWGRGEGHEFDLLLVAAEAATGDTVRARRELARMREEEAPPLILGFAHAALGEVDAAFDLFLREDAVWPEGTVVLLRYWFPDFMDRIRQDPRYREVVMRVQRAWKLEPDGRFGDLKQG